MNNQDEINLIKFFTRNKSLTRAQHARFESLVARGGGGFKPSNSIKKDSLKSKHQDLPEYISPKTIQLFLEQYNQNSILKYTCHLIDDNEVIDELCHRCKVEEYNYERHVDLIKREFDNLLKTFKNEPVSEKMTALISAYLKGEQKWSSDGIEINWCHESIKNWAKDNPGIIPNPGENIQYNQRHEGFSLPTDSIFFSKLTKLRIKDFGQLCIHFKNLFHIRFNNSLEMLIRGNFSKYINDKDQKDKKQVAISFSPNKFYTNIELFTDVDKLIQTIKKIIDICAKCSKTIAEKTKTYPIMPEIEIAFYQENKNIILTIHHINSQYQKSATNACERIGEEQTTLIKNLINGLADLHIEADFGNNEYGKINLWDGNERKFKRTSAVTGVKYILEF